MTNANTACRHHTRRLLALAGLAAALIGVFLFAACGGGGGGPGKSASAACGEAAGTPSETGKSTSEVLQSGSVTLGYQRYIPTAYDGTTPVPLVLLFHGFASNGENIRAYSRIEALAEDEGFVSVIPTSNSDFLSAGYGLYWNLSPGLAAPTQTPDETDLVAVEALLDEQEASLCIDTNRIYAAGYSNGGGMAELLACKAFDPATQESRIAAVGLVASARLQGCVPEAPYIAFHGEMDPFQLYTGDHGATAFGEYPTGGLPAEIIGDVPPIETFYADWASTKLECDSAPVESSPAQTTHVEQYTHGNCEGGAGEAVLYKITDGGHTWPGADPSVYPFATSDCSPTPEDVTTQCKLSQEIDATRTIWEFFAAHPK